MRPVRAVRVQELETFFEAEAGTDQTYLRSLSSVCQVLRSTPGSTQLVGFVPEDLKVFVQGLEGPASFMYAGEQITTLGPRLLSLHDEPAHAGNGRPNHDKGAILLTVSGEVIATQVASSLLRGDGNSVYSLGNSVFPAVDHSAEAALRLTEWLARSCRAAKGSVLVSSADGSMWFFTIQSLIEGHVYVHAAFSQEALVIIERLSSTSATARVNGLQTLAATPSEHQDHMLQKVATFMLDQEWIVRREAFLTLRAFPENGAKCAELVRRQIAHPMPIVQFMAAAALAAMPRSEVGEDLVRMYYDKPSTINAVRGEGRALEFVSPELLGDVDVVAAAVGHDGSALQFAAPGLRSDISIALAAVTQNKDALQFVDPALVRSHDGLRALEREGLALVFPYLVLEEVGRGVYGSVTKARHIETGEIVAIKKLHYDPEAWTDGIPSHVFREVSVLLDFQHPNVVELKNIMDLGFADFRLVFEFIPRDLHSVLKQYRQEKQLMPMRLVKNLTRGLLEGLHACHSRSLIHRDLKPQNVLIGHDNELKIVDFGLARMLTNTHQHYTLEVVTLWYRAPEILLGQTKYGFEVDIWSAGCVIAEMATSMPLFPGDSEIGTIFKIFKMLGTPSATNWPTAVQMEHFRPTWPRWEPTDLMHLITMQPELEPSQGADLLRRLLTVEPQVRFTARRAKSHPFVTDAIQTS